MKQTLNVFGLVALVLCIAILGVVSLHLGLIRAPQLALLLSGLGIFGTVGTVTYVYPVAGSTPPTLLQASRRNVLTCTVATVDGDTGFTITHNWNQPAGDQTNLFPTPIVNLKTPGTAPSLVSISSRTANTIVFAKATTAGTGATFEIQLLRPHSIIR